MKRRKAEKISCGIKLFEHGWREALRIQLGDEGFYAAMGQPDAHEPCGKGIETGVSQLQSVENDAVWEVVIRLRDGNAPAPAAGASRAQCKMQGQVKFCAVRQFYAVGNGPLLMPDADQAVPALPLQAGKAVIRLIAPIRQQNHRLRDIGSFHQFAQRFLLAFGALLFLTLLHFTA